MKKILFAIITSCSFLFSCNSDEGEAPPEVKTDSVKINRYTANSRLSEMSWLDGGWKMNMPDGSLFERWQTKSDTEMVGTGTLISEKGETMFSEKIRIVLRDNILWYMATIEDQNDGQEVAFKEVQVNANGAVFENAAHDYPQRIIYTKKAANEMQARIEGKVSGLSKSEDFSFNRLLGE